MTIHEACTTCPLDTCDNKSPDCQLAQIYPSYGDRTEYFADYYRTNAERKRASALARYYERKHDETYMEARRERDRVRIR